MITFAFLTILIFFRFRGEPPVLRFLLIFYFVSLSIFLLRSLEFAVGITPFFVSDEIKYAEADSYVLAELGYATRALWFWLNHLLIEFDLFGKVGIKLINIPVSALLFIAIAKIFRLERASVLLVVLVPYTFVMATYNLRDMLVLLVSVLFLGGLAHGVVKRPALILTTGVTLFFLRAEMVFVAIAVYGLFFVSRRGIWRKQAMTNALLLIGVLGIVVGIYGDQLLGFLDSRTAWVQHKYVENYAEFSASRGGEHLTGNIAQDLTVGVIRYIFAPVPTSLLYSGLSGDREFTYGIVEHVIRMGNQTIAYAMLVFLLIRMRAAVRVWRNLDLTQSVVLTFFLFHALIYGVYLLGGGHQRLKLPFQLGIAILCLLLVHRRSFMLRHAVSFRPDQVATRSQNEMFAAERAAEL